MERREEIRVHSGLPLVDTAARIAEILGGMVTEVPERWMCLLHPPDGSDWELAWESDGEMCLTVPAASVDQIVTDVAAATDWFLVHNGRAPRRHPNPAVRL